MVSVVNKYRCQNGNNIIDSFIVRIISSQLLRTWAAASEEKGTECEWLIESGTAEEADGADDAKRRGKECVRSNLATVNG